MNAKPEPQEPDFLPDDMKPDRQVVGVMTTSPEIGKIAAALAKAQGAFGKVIKESTAKLKGKTEAGKVYDYSYTYATLGDTIAAIRVALSLNEIAVLQPATFDHNQATVTTRLIHSSGQWIASDISMPVAGDKAQAVGSAITYGRRYALQAMVGLAPDDDDGAAAQANPPPDESRAGTRRVIPPKGRQRKPSAPKPEPQGAPPEDDGREYRGRDALAAYREASGDAKTNARVLMAEALGKPWPKNPTELDNEQVIAGLARMALAATEKKNAETPEPSEPPEDYVPSDGQGDQLPLDPNGHEHGS